MQKSYKNQVLKMGNCEDIALQSFWNPGGYAIKFKNYRFSK